MLLEIIDIKNRGNMNNFNLYELCLRDRSQCKNQVEPCYYIPKYNLCPICKENIVVYRSRCNKCGYDFEAESEE